MLPMAGQGSPRPRGSKDTAHKVRPDVGRGSQCGHSAREGGREGALKDRSQRLPCGSLLSRTDHPPGFVLVPYLVSWALADGEVGLAAHGGCCCEDKGVWPIALCCQAPHAGASLCLSPHVLLGPCLHPKEGPQGGGQWGRQALAPGASSNP